MGTVSASLAGISVAYALGVGLVCATCYGGIAPKAADPANVRNHWRGHLQLAATMLGVGVVGQIAARIV